MKMETLRKAVALAERLQHVFVATADTNGLPHVASAGKVSLAPDGHVILEDWFCPGTLANLHDNPRIAIVVWDSNVDTGYQLLGKVEEIRDLSMLDGYASGEEDQPPLPQVERELFVHMDKILAFSHAPHNDVAE